MIAGQVVAGRAATIPLTLQGSAQEQVVTLDAIIDTGFTGFLTLPLQQIARLGFAYEGIIDARLGDGRAVEFDMFAGAVLWNGHIRIGIVLAAEGTPLVGMALLSGSRITIDVTDGGDVAIIFRRGAPQIPNQHARTQNGNGYPTAVRCPGVNVVSARA